MKAFKTLLILSFFVALGFWTISDPKPKDAPPVSSDSDQDNHRTETTPQKSTAAPEMSSPAQHQRLKTDPANALAREESLATEEFLVAAQSLEKSDHPRAMGALRKRLLRISGSASAATSAATSPARSKEAQLTERAWLIALPRRFLQAGSHREFALWLLNQPDLHLSASEVGLSLETYFTEPPGQKQVLKDWLAVLRTNKDPDTQRMIAENLMFRSGEYREVFARKLSKVTELPSDTFLAMPTLEQSRIEPLPLNSGSE
jgi:hypothetical protein